MRFLLLRHVFKTVIYCGTDITRFIVPMMLKINIHIAPMRVWGMIYFVHTQGIINTRSSLLWYCKHYGDGVPRHNEAQVSIILIRVTGPSGGESTGHRCTPHKVPVTRASVLLLMYAWTKFWIISGADLRYAVETTWYRLQTIGHVMTTKRQHYPLITGSFVLYLSAWTGCWTKSGLAELF